MIRRLLLTALCFCLCCGMALAQDSPDPEFILNGETWGIKHKNSITPLPAAALENSLVTHAGLVTISVYSDDDSKPWKELKVPDGVYVGLAAGPLRRISALPSKLPPGPMTEVAPTPAMIGQFTALASLSPDKKILALGITPQWDGVWMFYSWPDLQPINAANFYLLPMQDGKPELLWARPDVAVMNVLVGDQSAVYDTRQCQYDPCAIVSVQSFNVSSNTASVLFEGTPTCDYYMRSASADVITADALCLKQASDWKEFPENITPKAVQKSVP